MKIRTRVLSLALLLVLMMSLMSLAACGDGNKTSPSPDTTSPPPADNSETPPPPPSGDAELTGDLVYWSMWNETEPQGMAIKEAIDEFMTLNPGVKVTVNWNGRDIRRTLQPALEGGTAIDMWDEDLERVTKNWAPFALPLDALTEKTFSSTDGKPYKEAVMGSLLNLAKGYSADGQLYCIPYQPFMFNVMYNKAHFADAGITSVPTTWEEFLDVCSKLKAAGHIPMTIDDAYMDCLAGYHLARYKGTPFVEQLMQDATNAMWDDPAVVSFAKDFETMAKEGYFSPNVAGNLWPAGQQEVAQGSVTMYLNGTWLVNELMPATGESFEWGTFAYPTVPGGTDTTAAANFGGQAFQINKDCKSPDAAFALIVHLTTGKWDYEIAKRTYGVPVGGTTDWPVQLADAKSIFNGLTTCYPWAGGVQVNMDKQVVLVANFTKLIAGQMTADEFLAAMKA